MKKMMLIKRLNFHTPFRYTSVMKEELHIFLTSSLYEGECSASHSRHLPLVPNRHEAGWTLDPVTILTEPSQFMINLKYQNLFQQLFGGIY
jgi:hypothetical protein